MTRRRLILGGVACVAGHAMATQIPISGRQDSRMRTVVYDRTQVVRLSTLEGAALVVTFAPGEKISAVAVTDSRNLAAVPRDNFLFLKSRAALSPQPVIVLTRGARGLRRYVLEVEAITAARQAAEHRDIYYSLEFRYPADEAAARIAFASDQAQRRRDAVARADAARAHAIIEQAGLPKPTANTNWHYVAQGSRALMPVEVYDNGYSTFFRFPGNVRVPAIFRINPDGTEATANTSVRGEYLMIPAVAAGWRLRDGRTMLAVWNRAYDRTGRPPATGTTTPAVRRVVKDSLP